MVIKREVYQIKCEHCGKLLDEEYFYDTVEDCKSILDECGWQKLGGRHYCDECWHYDDDDNIVTKDGRKYTEDGKEIKSYRMNYIEVGEWMTLTQFRMEMVRCNQLYNSMVGTVYRSMLADDLAVVRHWFDELLKQRHGTQEWECYKTFVSHGIFRLEKNAAYERMCNRIKR